MSIKSYYERRHLTSGFGDRRGGGRRHRGVDFSHSTRPNTIDVPAIEGGTVVGKLAPGSWHGFGHQVTIQSGSRRWSYAHLPTASPLRVGQQISAGTIVGREGRTGSTTGNCVHIELHNGSGFVNPAPTIEALRVVSGGVKPKPTPAPRPTAQPRSSGNNTLAGLPWRGVQRMLKGTGRYSGAIDNIPGRGSIKGLQDFLNDAGYSRQALGRDIAEDGLDGGDTLAATQQWLKRKWGYTGRIDRIRGAGTTSAWGRAEAANGRAFAHVR